MDKIFTNAVKVGVPESEHFLPIYGWHPSRFTKKWKSIISHNRWTNPSTYVTYRWQIWVQGLFDYIISKSILELMWRISLIQSFWNQYLDSIILNRVFITFQLWIKTTICRRFYLTTTCRRFYFNMGNWPHVNMGYLPNGSQSSIVSEYCVMSTFLIKRHFGASVILRSAG